MSPIDPHTLKQRPQQIQNPEIQNKIKGPDLIISPPRLTP